MKWRINVLTLLVLSLALVAFLASFALLFHPIGKNIAGSAETSSAISASLALIIATIGLVIALYIQSAEYRRETEIVDGLQEARILIELMISRISVAQASQRDISNLRFEFEKEQLIETLKGSAGRFLNYIRMTKDATAQEKQLPESWRLLYVHTGSILNATNIAECASNLVGLHDLLKSISSEDVHKNSNYVTSVKSIDALNAKDDILIEAFRQHSTSVRQRNESESIDLSDEEFSRMTEALRLELEKSEQGRRAWAELEESIARASAGDNEAKAYVVSLHEALVAPRK